MAHFHENFSEEDIDMPAHALVPGQETYWIINSNTVADLPPLAGVAIPGYTGFLRPYEIRGEFIRARDEAGMTRGVVVPRDSAAPARYRGNLATSQGTLSIVSFRPYEAAADGLREPDERIVAVEGFGYGRFGDPQHATEHFGPYFRGYLLGTCAVGEVAKVSHRDDQPDPNTYRNFSLARTGFLGDPTDPAFREAWGIDYIPE
jgi:hypothetical protein